jgi:hypothetical protein
MNKRIILTSLFVALIFSSFIIYSSFAQTLPICVAPQQYLYWQPGQHAAGYVPFASTSINFLMRSPIYVSGGNVGIGTNNPQAKLHINAGVDGNLRLDSGDNNILYIGHDPDVGDWIQFRPENAKGLAFLKGPDAPAMVVANTGNVGIGTTNPQAKLHVEGGILIGGTGITPTIRLGTDRAGRNFQIVGNTAGPLLDFQLDNGTSLMSIRSTGNVGIGTNNPQYKLQVVSGSGRWTAINADGSIVVNRDGAPPYILFQGSGGGISYIYNPSEGTTGRAMAFYTQANGQNYSEKVRITGAGNVGIGTTNPQAKLHVVGDILSSNKITANQFCIGTNCITQWPSQVAQYWTLSGNNLYTSSTNWNVGIGTNNPLGYRLRVEGGDVLIGNGNTDPSIVFKGRSGDNHAAIRWATNDLSTQKVVLGVYGDNAWFYPVGNVGIGTTTPQAKLHVEGNTIISNRGTDPSLIFYGRSTDNASAIRFRVATDNYDRSTILNINSNLIFYTGGSSTAHATEKMRITSAGNVGIGTTNPLEKLHVEGAIRTRGLRLGIVDTTNKYDYIPIYSDQGGGYIGGLMYSSSSSYGINSFTIYSANNRNIILYPGSGNVGIGTNNPRAKLEVAGAIRLTPTSQPSNATTGMMYFDQSSGVFKCFQKDPQDNLYKWMDCTGKGPQPPSGIATLTVPVKIYDSSGQRIVLEINEE